MKHKKRLAACLLTAALTVSTLCTGAFAWNTPIKVAHRFEDVGSSDWFCGAVQTAFDKGYMSGTSNTTFVPRGATTRAAFVQTLYAKAGSPSVSSTNPFQIRRLVLFCGALGEPKRHHKRHFRDNIQPERQCDAGTARCFSVCRRRQTAHHRQSFGFRRQQPRRQLGIACDALGGTKRCDFRFHIQRQTIFEAIGQCNARGNRNHAGLLHRRHTNQARGSFPDRFLLRRRVRLFRRGICSRQQQHTVFYRYRRIHNLI